jgi:septum formation protein
LRELGLDFQVVLREVDEQFPEGMPPAAVAEHLAVLKADACRDLAESHIVVTADTVVALNGALLGKPKDHAEAKQMLQALSGQTNQVISAVCISYQGQQKVFHSLTQVHFRHLADWEIDHYVEAYQPTDKAGAYGIQEWIGMVGITGIEGDYYNVVGMPVGLVWDALKAYFLPPINPVVTAILPLNVRIDYLLA